MCRNLFIPSYMLLWWRKSEKNEAAVVALKPIRAQIDGARAALALAQARHEKAVAAMEEILQKISETDNDITSLTEKLTALEASVPLADSTVKAK